MLSETIPFYPGSTFSIAASAGLDFITGSPVNSGAGEFDENDGLTFTLQEADGTPVTPTLIPEPSTDATAGLSLAFAALGLFRHKRKP